mgnify:CR=1 FL=1
MLLVGGTGWLLYMNAQKQKRAQAMLVITGGQNLQKRNDKNRQVLKKREEIARKLKEATDEKKKEKGKKPTTKELWQQAGFEGQVKKFWIGSAIFGFFFFLLIANTGIPVVAKVLFTFVGFLGLPRFFLKWKAARRQKEFLEGFSDALEAMIRLLQAGMPVSEAIAMVAREYEGPIGDEMRHIYDDQKIGIPMGEAAERCAKRMPLTEVKMFATAIQIQSETGSSLSEVLANLAAVIRARFRLKRKVKALSSEAKASAAIIGALPLLVAFGLYMVNEEYIMLLFTTQTGKMLATGAGIWMFIGVLVMRQMINFKI